MTSVDLKTFLFLFPGRKWKFISYTGMEKNLRKKSELVLRTYCFCLVELQETLAVHSVCTDTTLLVWLAAVKIIWLLVDNLTHHAFF